MTDDEICGRVSGAAELIQMFGHWPSFHDGEVTRLELNRIDSSYLHIHTFAMTAEVDASGHYVTEKHVVVRFILDEVSDLQLIGFNQQNVISGRVIQTGEEGIRLTLGGCYGLEGAITAKQVRIDCELGVPRGSVYSVGIG